MYDLIGYSTLWNLKYKILLSSGQVHVTDYSNASSTGMFDPFVVSVNYIAH